MRGVDIVLTATNSSVPVFDGNLLEPGQHVTTIVGSNVGLVKGGFTAAKRREIDDATLARSNVHGIVSIQQAVQDEQADIYDPVNRGVIKWEQLIEIGSILAGNSEGRTRIGPNHLLQKQRRPRRRRCRAGREGAGKYQSQESGTDAAVLRCRTGVLEYYHPILQFIVRLVLFLYVHPAQR